MGTHADPLLPALQPTAPGTRCHDGGLVFTQADVCAPRRSNSTLRIVVSMSMVVQVRSCDGWGQWPLRSTHTHTRSSPPCAQGAEARSLTAGDSNAAGILKVFADLLGVSPDTGSLQEASTYTQGLGGGSGGRVLLEVPVAAAAPLTQQRHSSPYDTLSVHRERARVLAAVTRGRALQEGETPYNPPGEPRPGVPILPFRDAVGALAGGASTVTVAFVFDSRAAATAAAATLQASLLAGPGGAVAPATEAMRAAGLGVTVASSATAAIIGAPTATPSPSASPLAGGGSSSSASGTSSSTFATTLNAGAIAGVVVACVVVVALAVAALVVLERRRAAREGGPKAVDAEAAAAAAPGAPPAEAAAAGDPVEPGVAPGSVSLDTVAVVAD